MPPKAHSHADVWGRLQWFLGFDRAKDDHDVLVLDGVGRVKLRRTVPNTAEGRDALGKALRGLAGDDLAVVGVAIETSRGPDVDRIIDLGCTVYPVHPTVSKRLRERKAPAGVKDNHLDAWALGDGLRTDGHAWRSLRPDSDRTRTLRMLCRDEVGLIQQRTALVNQLRAALREYYPAALEAFDDWTVPAPWSFLTRFPTPARLARALRCLAQRWGKILWKMWQTRTPYDEALHTRNQVSHGSWVLALISPRPVPPQPTATR